MCCSARRLHTQHDGFWLIRTFLKTDSMKLGGCPKDMCPKICLDEFYKHLRHWKLQIRVISDWKGSACTHKLKSLGGVIRVLIYLDFNLRNERQHRHNDRRTGSWPSQQNQNERWGGAGGARMDNSWDTASSYTDMHWNVMLQGHNSTRSAEATPRLGAGVFHAHPPIPVTTPAPFHGAPTRSLAIAGVNQSNSWGESEQFLGWAGGTDATAA